METTVEQFLPNILAGIAVIAIPLLILLGVWVRKTLRNRPPRCHHNDTHTDANGVTFCLECGREVKQ